MTDAKLLRINLSNSDISEEPIPKELLILYLGGRGLASRYLANEIDPGIDPFSDANKLIFADGLLSGTTAPTGGRYMVITKGPLTGTIASSNSGGFWGAELRKTGYLMVIIEGRSEKPCYIAIVDGKTEIRDASGIWGQDV